MSSSFVICLAFPYSIGYKKNKLFKRADFNISTMNSKLIKIKTWMPHYIYELEIEYIEPNNRSRFVFTQL